MADDSDEQLEQRVEQVEQQLSKMLPGRRGVLKGLGAAAIGGAAVGGATGGASGQSAAGQIGTSGSPVDVEAANVNAGSVNTGDVNKTLYAASPDDIQAKMDALPASGGRVNLIPGSYDDSDWSQTLNIPDVDALTLDLRGSDITLSSFAGDYVENQNGSRVLQIFGPDSFDVSAISNPGTVLDMWSISKSLIWWPDCTGPVDAIFRGHGGSGGSGHMNRVIVGGFGIQKGIIIGDTADTTTFDRSWYFGQLNRIEDVGVDIQHGRQNVVFVQPENEKNGFNATGIRDRGVENRILLSHSKTSTPLDIQAGYSEVHIPRFGLEDCVIGIPPRDIYIAGSQRDIQTFSTDPSPLMDTSSPSGGGVGTTTTVREMRLDPGTTDGDIAVYQTPTGIGNPQAGATVHTQTDISTSANRTVRFGLHKDSSNSAMLIDDSTVDGNWHVITRDSGIVIDDIDTGVASDTERHDYSIHHAGGVQHYFIDREKVAETSVSFGFTGWQMRERADISVNGSPSSAPLLELQTFENIRVEEQRIKL